MRRQRNFLVLIALAAVVVTSALGQTVTPGDGPASGETDGATSIPDFTSASGYTRAFPGSSRRYLVPAR